ncbi:MAG: TIGR00266 family protein [Verrucomicrobia bacterium]|jgi:uncharacterized protein (TIGR00266 family)|nr:MAG: TIGR00266 family protein [Verrucomicrobiota bacterium]
MQTEIIHSPGAAAARVRLDSGETLTAEGGAMIAIGGEVAIETTTHQKGKGGGLLKAAKRLLGGESFFLNHYTAGASGGEVWLAQTLPGDMMKFALEGQSLIVQAGSFVACSPGVGMEVGWQGFKNFLSGESLFWLRIGGTGRLILSSYGAIYPVQVNGEYIVDTGHIVAFDETLNFKLSKAGKSWWSSILGGEGLVCKFQGQGIVWCQSHNEPSFGHIIGPKLRAR